MEEPGGLQSMGSLGVGHDWATSLSLFTFMHWKRKWQPTPVFLPGESQGMGEPGGLPSRGSHGVGHDWSDLAAAAAAAGWLPNSFLVVVSGWFPRHGGRKVLHFCCRPISIVWYFHIKHMPLLLFKKMKTFFNKHQITNNIYNTYRRQRVKAMFMCLWTEKVVEKNKIKQQWLSLEKSLMGYFNFLLYTLSYIFPTFSNKNAWCFLSQKNMIF